MLDSLEFISKEAVKGLSGSMKFLGHLVRDFPGRQCGTEMGNRAAEYIYGVCTELGLYASKEEFSLPGYTQQAGYVTLSLKNNRGEKEELFRCRAETLIYSPVGVVTGLLSVHERDRPIQVSTGKQVVISNESLREYRNEPDAISAWIYITPDTTRGGCFSSSVADSRTASFIGNIPACSVSREDGNSILEIQRSVDRQLHVEVMTAAEEVGTMRRGVNIVAKLLQADEESAPGRNKGKPEPAEYIIAGSHFDSFLNVPGATDNAAGTAVLFGAAGILSKMREYFPFRRNIAFVTFDGEELGLLGSKDYVGKHKGELGLCRCMVNLDCAGKIGRKALQVHAWDDFPCSIGDIAAQIPCIEGRVDSWFSYRSDHQPFWRAGVPTIYGYGGMQPLAYAQHTLNDTLDKVIPDGLLTDTIITATLLYHLASYDELPWRNRTDAEMKNQLQEYGLLQKIEQF